MKGDANSLVLAGRGFQETFKAQSDTLSKLCSVQIRGSSSCVSLKPRIFVPSSSLDTRSVGRGA